MKLLSKLFAIYREYGFCFIESDGDTATYFACNYDRDTEENFLKCLKEVRPNWQEDFLGVIWLWTETRIFFPLFYMEYDLTSRAKNIYYDNHAQQIFPESDLLKDTYCIEKEQALMKERIEAFTKKTSFIEKQGIE